MYRSLFYNIFNVEKAWLINFVFIIVVNEQEQQK